MMATNPELPRAQAQASGRRSSGSTRPLPLCPKPGLASRSRRRPGLLSRRSADLAGRAVALSGNVPAAFDTPLESHHRAIGRWIAGRTEAAQLLTRTEARRFIEQEFEREVMSVLGECRLAELRVVVLKGEQDNPPAIAVVCDSVGQVELGWIESTNVLANTLKGSVAPTGWRAAAYNALSHMLSMVIPLFNFEQMIEELALYYWDGEISDEGARKAIEFHNGELEEGTTLPSDIAAKRPDFMLTTNIARQKDLPKPLRARLKRLHDAYTALKRVGPEGNAWYFDFHETCEYLPEYEDCSTLPPMTLVPADQFGMELDEVGRMGMEMRFFDIAGFCPLTGPEVIDQWLASLRLGGELIMAAQALIETDPMGERA